MYQIFRVPTHQLGLSSQPDYTVREGGFFPTVSHPDGWSSDPFYELGPDGKIYRSHPDYDIGPDCLLYRTVFHPEGLSPAPQYEIREMAL